MTVETETQPKLKNQVVIFPKKYYDIATILPTVKERHDFILQLLASMFDADVIDWVKNERINMLIQGAYVRIKTKLSKPFEKGGKTI